MESNEKVEVGDPTAPASSWWKSQTIHFLILVGMGQVLLLGACAILPAFFPLQAANKGSTPIEYGLIIGVAFLSMGVISIPWGHVATKFSSKLQLVISVIATAIFTVIFGFVDRLPNGAAFLGAAFTLRILMGAACGVFQIVAYAMVPVILVGRESTGFAIMEMGVGLGYIIGPALGGTLFDLGGFYLPLVGIGACLFIFAVFCLLFIHNPAIIPSEESVSMASFLFSPCAILYSLVIFSTETDFGYLATTLEPALNRYNLSHSAIGGIVVCSGASYALTTPLWGYILDKGGSAEFGSLFGTLTACIMFFFYGPVPWIPIGQCLWRIIFCTFICGLAVAAKMVAGFNLLMHSALVIGGCPDNVVTYAAVSALFTLVVSIGGFAGPFLGGLLTETMGMKGGSSVMFFWELFLMTGQILYIIKEKYKSSSVKPQQNGKIYQAKVAEAEN